MERKIFRIESISHDGQVKVFALSPEDGTNIQFRPGQFAVLFRLEDGKFGTFSRPYSLASSPLDKNLRFAIKITGGQFTTFLDGLKQGDRLGLAAPFGQFAYNDEENAIFLAAGTGIAPMLGMLEYISQKKKQGKFTLFYSSKTQDGIIGKEILDSCSKEDNSVKLVYTLTQEQPEGWKGELGRIDENMVKKYADYVPNSAIFICGPLEFAKKMKDIVLKLGADETKIRSEAWG